MATFQLSEDHNIKISFWLQILISAQHLMAKAEATNISHLSFKMKSRYSKTWIV